MQPHQRLTLRIVGYVALAAWSTAPLTEARAADDTARFFGTWSTSFPYNGQTVTIVSVHDASGYRNTIANVPAGNGTFAAADGKYKAGAEKPNDSGTYRFVDDDEVVCTNAAGQTQTWRRVKASGRDAAAPASAGKPATRPPPAVAAEAPDPSLPPETNAAIAAFNKKDYDAAWRNFMAAAQKGDAEAEAGVGAMLFKHLNPPGTGFYAQCERWLLAAANQGNVKGMDFLGQYYYESAAAIAGGINPGVNNSPIPPALQKQAEGRFALARQWFDRAAANGDLYAAGNLAIMLDAGVGGPRDAARAERLRAQVGRGPDAEFAKRATADPDSLSVSAEWQAGHYADAVNSARVAAAKGDARAEALLGRAYYEGVGVARDYATALGWLNKAVAQNNADAMFFLGLMYEFGRGVPQDVDGAQGLFDRAAALGQRYAEMEAKGMRMEGEAAAQVARFVAACRSKGAVADPPLCLVGDVAIDPY